MRNRFALRSLVLLVAVALGACGKKAPAPPPPGAAPAGGATPASFKVVSVDLGNAIGDDRKIRRADTQFGLHDTIYASVLTSGAAPRATIKVRWTYGQQGTLVNEESREIAPAGPAVSEFHIAKPSGWLVGDYRLEVSIDGNVVATKDFKVAKS